MSTMQGLVLKLDKPLAYFTGLPLLLNYTASLIKKKNYFLSKYLSCRDFSIWNITVHEHESWVDDEHYLKEVATHELLICLDTLQES